MTTVTLVETSSPDRALELLLENASKQLVAFLEADIRTQYEELVEIWGSRQLFQGTLGYLKPIIKNNLNRISKEQAFRTFRVIKDAENNYMEIIAIFPKTFVPVRVWRNNTTLYYVCGNSLFSDKALKKWWKFW